VSPGTFRFASLARSIKHPPASRLILDASRDARTRGFLFRTHAHDAAFSDSHQLAEPCGPTHADIILNDSSRISTVDAKRPPNFRPAVAAVDLFHEFSADRRERDARDKTLGRTRENILIALFHFRSFSRRASRASLVIQTFGVRAPRGLVSRMIGVSRRISKEIRGRWKRDERSRDKESNERVTNRELGSLSPLV